MEEMKICQKCKKAMRVTNFYKNRDGSYTDLCKNCLTMHIDNFDPETFTWILKEMDLPYIPEEWDVLRDRAFAKNPNLKTTSVFGKYLSKMKLKQFKDAGWEDSERLQEARKAKDEQEAEERKEYEEKLKEQLDNGEIGEAQYKTLVSAVTQNEELQYAVPAPPVQDDNPFEDPSQFIDESLLIDLGADLTDDDKTYLAMKWGRLYKPSEWVELEKIYKDMTDSFDIQDADTISTLILICKTNLKMNRAIDEGDLEGFQKLSKVSESLRKSAKFTAAQNKDKKENYVDSVGELITMCERDGFIPRFATDIAQDKVDATLQDMNNYVRKLVTQDLGFGQQIEDAIKKIQIQQEMQQDLESGNTEVDDEDFEEFYEEIAAQKELDEMTLNEQEEE